MCEASQNQDENRIPSSCLSKEEVNNLPIFRYAGSTELVTDSARAETVVKCLRKEAVLGFDTETRPAFRKGEAYLPSLIQLAAADCVYLFHLGHMHELGPLSDLFADAGIVKAGVAVARDVRELQQISLFAAAGFTDLGVAAKAAGLVKNGLRNLAATFLEARISKSAQCSNWSRPELSEKQIVYAATDAWVSRAIYLKFQELGICMPELIIANPGEAGNSQG